MNEENIKSEDYIGLPPIKKITIEFLRFIFSVFDNCWEIIKKIKLLLITGLVLGLAMGIFYYSIRPSYYEVSMIAESHSAYRKTLDEMIQSLNKLIISNSYGKLASELDINEQQASQISFIGMTGLLNEPLDNDTSTKFNQPFKISIHLSNSTLTDTFQTAIAHYLNNSPFFKKTNEEQVKYYNEKLIFIDRELAKLDTLKTAYNRFFSSPQINATYFNNNADPANIYKQSNDLMNEKGNVMYLLSANAQPIQIIDAFKRPTLPQSFSRPSSLVYGALIGLGICLLLGFYTELHRKIGSYEGKP